MKKNQKYLKFIFERCFSKTLGANRWSWFLFFFVLMVLPTTISYSQPDEGKTIEIEGRVTDSKDIPLPGVNVTIKGTSKGTITDLDGNYSLETSSDATLEFSYIGYEKQVVSAKGQSTINIQLTKDVKEIDEIVVIGYGTQKRSQVTGSISSIESDEFEIATTSQTDRILQGKASGLRVTRNSGAPGEGARVRIRGLTGITESNPLYVVDGAPMENISHLNPSDIQSVEVLKDASSAAIYGARGADGVILVTTKQGQAGETKISFDANMGISNISTRLDKWNSEEFIMHENLGWFMDQGHYAIGEGEYFSEEGEKGVRELSKNTYDWFDAVTRQGNQKNMNLSISGGEDNFSYFVSGNYYNEEGIVIKSGYQRYGARLNTRYEATDWLTIGENIVYSIEQQDEVNQANIDYARTISPFIPLEDSVGERVADWYQPNFNPLAHLEHNDKLNTKRRLQGNAFIKITPFKGLDVQSKIIIDDNEKVSKSWSEQYQVGMGNPSDYLNRTVTTPFLWNWQNTMTYQNIFADVHELNILGGVEAQEETKHYSIEKATDFVLHDPSMRYIRAGSKQLPIDGGEETWSLMSYFGRLSYDFNDRYYLTTSIRRDGSSRFGPNTRWGNFGSISGAWSVHNEEFMQAVNGISNLKLRAGWGATGDQSLSDPYPYYALLIQDRPDHPLYPWGQGPAGSQNALDYYDVSDAYRCFMPDAPSNPNLGWEEVRSMNYGIDLGLFDNKLTLTAEYYKRTTVNMLVEPTVSYITGFSRSGYTNLGEFLNTGLDVDLKYKQKLNDFYYSFTINSNIPVINNRVVDLGGQDDFLYKDFSGEVTRKVTEGETFGAYYGNVIEGIFQNQEEIDNHAFQTNQTRPGDYKYKDLNGDGIINAHDRTFLGTPYADFMGGINMVLRYKIVSLTASGSYSIGNKIISSVPIAFNKNGLDRWTPENPDASLSRFTQLDGTNDNKRMSDLYIHDGSYFRIQNLSLALNMPEKWMNETNFFTNAQLYFRASNLIVLTYYQGIDPEVGGSGLGYGHDGSFYPFSKTYIMGLNFSF